MKRKICILITCDYPYSTGEAFIEDEMPYLSESFERIIIFPINIKHKEKMTRAIPDNVDVYPVGCIHNIFRIPYFMLKGVFVFDKNLKVFDKSIKRISVNLYARGRSTHIKNFVLKMINKKHVDCNNAVIYSYWFSDQAIAAWKIKDSLQKNFINIKSIARAHGYDLYCERNAAHYLPYQDTSLSKLDGVFPCSDDGSQYLISKYPLYANKIKTARLGTIDYGLAPIPSNKIIFVTCCSLKKLKRISLFAQSFIKILKTNKECFWFCVGQGEEFDLIHSIIVENSIESHVEMKGYMKNSDILNFYKQNPISFFVNVSESEGVPVSIMEAISYGIPVIATNVGGTKEIINSNNGLLLDANIDADSLAEAVLNEITLDRNEYLKKRTNARKTWEEYSSADKNYTEWCKKLLS